MKTPASAAAETVTGDTVANLTPPDEPLPGMTAPAPVNDPDPAPPSTRRGPGRPPRAGARPPRPSEARAKAEREAKPKNSSAAPAPGTPGRPSNHSKLAAALERQYVMAGAIARMFAPLTGEAMIENATSCAESLADWADSNPKVRAVLERTMQGGAVAGVLAAHLPIALAVYAEVAAAQPAPSIAPAPAPGATFTAEPAAARAFAEAFVMPDPAEPDPEVLAAALARNAPAFATSLQ